MCAVHFQPHEAGAALLLIKLAFGKYPITRSLIEQDSDSLPQNSASFHMMYKADINDPALSNASESNILFELVQLSLRKTWISPSQMLIKKLARSIAANEPLPQEVLGFTALTLCKKLYEQEQKAAL